LSEQLTKLATHLAESRTSRRGALVRLAVFGSALTVGPIRYLLRPTTAWAVTTCSDCSSGAPCCDGYTTFCCTINNGSNTCPSGTFRGGWWKCTHYNGNQLCDAYGVRYYVDCHRNPSEPDCTCKCANGACSNRHTCCTTFRYGQCNTQITARTEIVCRRVTCISPCTMWPGDGTFGTCNCTFASDDDTCTHEATCL
jgi:hypothetical protein